jgi:hypothetical protein
LSPEEAIKLLREHALELIEFHGKMSAFEHLNPEESQTVLSLCLYLIEELAENRWFTSEIIERYDSGDPPIFMPQDANHFKIVNEKEGPDLSSPPFDYDYFSNLKDL